MSTLANFPMLSQLADSNINREFDCVPASIAAALEYLTRRIYTAGAIKDAAYGSTYTGGTAARAFIGYCKLQGVELYPIDNADLVALVHQLRNEIEAGHPVLITEPDPYLPPNSGFTHVCVAYADDLNGVTVMDPFIAAPVWRSNQDWAGVLQDQEIWGMKPLMGAPQGWKDDGTTLSNPYNNYTVHAGFRKYILENAWSPDNYPEENEHGRTPLEDSNPAMGGGTQQVFRFSMLGWTPAQGVFIESVGQELAKCRQEIAALRMTPVGTGAAAIKAMAAQLIALLQQL